jgi:hypothetical protein
MLREAKNANFVREGVVFRRYVLVQGRKRIGRPLKQEQFRCLQAAQETEAVSVAEDEARQYWWFQGCFYWEDEQLSGRDVLALVHERRVRAQRKLERAHAVLSAGQMHAGHRRNAIPREVRNAVFQRDGGCCVECGSNFDIQYDHVIPHSMGGADSVENLQILCAPCNQSKGASIG